MYILFLMVVKAYTLKKIRQCQGSIVLGYNKEKNIYTCVQLRTSYFLEITSVAMLLFTAWGAEMLQEAGFLRNSHL